MPFSSEILFAASIAAAAFLAGLWVLYRRSKRTRSVGLRPLGGPANLRFTCAGCSGQFTHSRRTISAWGKGTRRFYCNACHTKWQGSHQAQSPADKSRFVTRLRHGSNPAASAPSPAVQAPSPAAPPSGPPGKGGGCLGIAVLLLALPTVLLAAVLHCA